MKIANADKLIHHFENTVDVKLFTPAQICTIIDTFSVEIPDTGEIVMPRHMGMSYTNQMMSFLNDLFKGKPGIDNKPLSEEQISEGHEDD